jgi:phenylalanyl-tRNA synthetase beta chain
VRSRIASERAVVLDAPAACPRYCGRVIAGIDAAAATPPWMRRRLERSGLRPISALVDITNYVMLELGQPLHAFDNQQLARCHSRTHGAGGRDDQAAQRTDGELQPDILLIADERRPLAMAGIMGGEDSGITLATTEVFLEAAFFAPEGDRRARAALRFRFGCVSSFRARRRFRCDAACARTCDAPGFRHLWRPGRSGQRGAGEPAAAAAGASAPARVRKVLGWMLTAERIGELFRASACHSSRDARISSSRRPAIASTSRSRKT